MKDKNPMIQSLAEIGRIEFANDVARDYDFFRNQEENFPEDVFDEIIDTFLDLMSESGKMSMGDACVLLCLFGEDDETPPDEEHNTILRAALGHAIFTGQYVRQPEEIDPQKTNVYFGKHSHLRLRSRFLRDGIGDKTKIVLKKLIDTIQYQNEVINRMEEAEQWYMINLTDEQLNKFKKDVLKYTDEDFGLEEQMIAEGTEKALEMIEELKKKF